MTEYENLIAGPFPLQKDTVTIGGNQTLKAGCVLGFKSVSAGAKGKYRFALSSITAAAGTVSVTIGENTFSIDTTAEGSNHTIDEILDSLAAAVNASSLVAFEATADKSNDYFILEAKSVGTWAGDVTISMAKTGDLVLTIGNKTQVTAPADASTGEFFAVDHTEDDGTQTARAVLLEDITVANGSLGKAVVAYTGCFNKSKLTFGGSDTIADQYTNMLDHCIFAVDVVEP